MTAILTLDVGIAAMAICGYASVEEMLLAEPGGKESLKEWQRTVAVMSELEAVVSRSEQLRK